MKETTDNMGNMGNVKSNGKSKRCHKCGKTIALKYFSKDSRAKDGYRTTCKLCDKKSQHDSRTHMTYASIQEKTCTECGNTKPIAEFGVDKTKKDGHRSYCLECMRFQQKLRNRIKIVKQPKSHL